MTIVLLFASILNLVSEIGIKKGLFERLSGFSDSFYLTSLQNKKIYKKFFTHLAIFRNVIQLGDTMTGAIACT